MLAMISSQVDPGMSLLSRRWWQKGPMMRLPNCYQKKILRLSSSGRSILYLAPGSKMPQQSSQLLGCFAYLINASITIIYPCRPTSQQRCLLHAIYSSFLLFTLLSLLFTSFFQYLKVFLKGRSMQVESSKDSGLKIRYNCKGKIISKKFIIKGRGYSDLCLKISESFALDQQQMHVLFYHGPQKDVITVRCEEDYNVFIRTISPLTLELDSTDDPQKDFMRAAAKQKNGDIISRNEEQLHEREEMQTESQKRYQMRKSEPQDLLQIKRSQVSKDQEERLAKVNEQIQTVKQQYEEKLLIQEAQIDNLKTQILQTVDEMNEKDKQIQKCKIQLQRYEQRIQANQRDEFQRSNKLRQKLQQEYNQKAQKLQKKYQQKLQSKDERIKLLQNNCQNKQISYKIEEEKDRLLQELAQFKDRMKEECERKIGQFFIKLKSRKCSNTRRKVGCSQQNCRFWKEKIVGVMYRCLKCPEFNLCEDCQILGKYEHDSKHPLIKIYDDCQIQPEKEEKKQDASQWPEWSENDKKNYLVSLLGVDQTTTLHYIRRFPLLGPDPIAEMITDGS